MSQLQNELIKQHTIIEIACSIKNKSHSDDRNSVLIKSAPNINSKTANNYVCSIRLKRKNLSKTYKKRTRKKIK